MESRNGRGLQIIGRSIWYVSILFLVLYPLRHANVGVDLWDGGYNYANFCYNDLEHMDSMWFYATWLANVIGHIIALLPFADTMLVMNIYAGILVGIIGAGAYVFCVKRLQIPAWLAFMGEVLALSLCWAPVSVFYNYLTYGFLLAGVLCIYQGLVKEKARFLILAGAFLGINIGNRFSNLVEVSLILAVWYYGGICRKRFSDIARDTGFCVLGYLGGAGLFLGVMAIMYGLPDYIEGIRQLFVMTEYATDYSTGHMIAGMVGAYLESSYWLKRYGVILAAAMGLCLATRKWRRVACVGAAAVMVAGVVWLVSMNYAYRDYASYLSIYDPCVIVFIMAMLLAFYQMLSSGYSKEEKLQAVFVPLLILLTSLGGNNAVYSSINNLFFVLPCFLEMTARFITREKKVWMIPFQGILLVGICLLLYQGILFGQAFVYEEADGGRSMNTKIEEIPVLKGMYTGKEKAEHMTELYRYLKTEELLNRECILYGDIPAIAYYLELTPAINVWSDLRSYGQERMQKDLEAVDLSDKEIRPIIIMEEKAVRYLAGLAEENGTMDKLAETKLEFLGGLMEQYNYHQVFHNGKYAVYR